MFNGLKKFFRVAFNEWKLFYTDSAAVMLLVIAGILYGFYYPTAYLNQIYNEAPVAIVDLDNTQMSRKLVRMAEAAQQIKLQYIFKSVEEAERALAKSEIFGYMVIPPAMEKRLRTNEQVVLNIFTHGAYAMLHGNIGTAFTTCALTLGAETKVKQIALAKKTPASRAIAMRDPIPLSIQTLYNSVGSYSNYAVPSVFIVILQQTLAIGICVLGGARAHRKFRGKYQNSKAENASLLYRYFGRAFAYFFHYVSFIIFYHFVIYSVFDFPRRGETLPLLIFTIVFLFTTINFGMVLSQIFRRRETSIQIFLFMSIPFLFLSGFSWPHHLMPSWMVAISKIIPSTFAIPSWLAIEQMGASLSDAAPNLWRLALLGVFYFALGLLLTKLRDKKPSQKADW